MDMTAFPALNFSLAQKPCLPMRLAIRAHVAIRPSYLDKILQARSIIYENVVEHFSIEWVCVHAHTLHVKLVTSSLYPYKLILVNNELH